MHIYMNLEAGKLVTPYSGGLGTERHMWQRMDKMMVLRTACGKEIHTKRPGVADKLVKMSIKAVLCPECKEHPMYDMWLLKHTDLE